MLIINILNIYILLTFLHLIISKVKQKELFWILTITAINVIVTEVVLRNGWSYRFNTNIYLILTFFFWLHVLRKQFVSKIAYSIYGLFAAAAITLFSIYNIIEYFNKLFFACCSIIYLVAFIILCYNKLKQENLKWFQSNLFLLLCAPLLYFLGMSLLWGFQNNQLNNYLLFGKFRLYLFINLTVNFVLYTLLNLYIFKAKHANN